MTISELLEEFRKIFGNERDKGTAFEKLIKMYLENEPIYISKLDKVWMWSDFPYRDRIGDTGIDLVAKTFDDEYWAIQCKFYAEDHQITKADVDTFLSTSSKYFEVDGEKKKFSYRLIASTTNNYNHIAEETLKNQDPPVGRISYENLLESQIDWKKYSLISQKVLLKEKLKPKEHQKKAIKDVLEGFKTYDRGKLIMACGTGKTFTSLRIAEEQLNGKGNVLFLVPSIALASQTLTEWSAQCRYTFHAAVVCSDNKASKGSDSVDLGFPSTTDVRRLREWSEDCKNNPRDINFIFSTYQSIDVVSKFQKESNFDFDIIICDEAHRTTGVTLADDDESAFVKVHNNDFIHGKKRLYMTATPRIYGDAVKGKATEVNAELCSMDDEKIYGPQFHNLTFSEAVKQNLLTDYKVLILAVDEEYVKEELKPLFNEGKYELTLEDSVKIMGCWNGLSKISIFNDKDSFVTDPQKMKRAVAFCNRIKDSQKLVEMFKIIQEHVKGNKYSNEKAELVNVDIMHVDGSFNALEKKDRLNWLKDDIEDGNCRILTNAKCLSEGVDVPALDAVMFLNPRSSMVDIIQSVGRVMRRSEGKQYGYIILPIAIRADEDPNDALDNNEKYRMVWEVLQALRAHDDRFNNTINKIDLNKKRPDQIDIIGIGSNKGQDTDNGKKLVDAKDDIKKTVQIQLDLNTFDAYKDAIYSKMVKRVGSRIYWENWAKDVAKIAQAHIDRIKMLLESNDADIKKTFAEFVNGLKKNLNNSITEDDAIEMLAEHMITKPVFDALFDKYEFVKNNPVSQSMQAMMDILDRQKTEEETEKLNKFYASVKERAEGIDNAAGKQKIILELYEKFFKTALPKEVEKLGIVYTPTECVDFIINSVEYLMNKEFGKSLSDHGVHIIDGFTGTGTFIVRLLQSGAIKKEDLLYKYTNEIHANEIVLLAYYIAAINIEETFHELFQMESYIPFEGIVLTDTFQLYEDSDEHEWTKNINELTLPQNSERALKQRELPITVCIGNPPYSVGQKNQNDIAENLKYPKLDNEIYLKYSQVTGKAGKHSLYDSYIRAFRWAADRIKENGIVSFITNGAFIDNSATEGLRKSFIDEFTSVYIFNLRGNARTSGEQRRKEKDNVFGMGTRTPVAITCLVKNSIRGKDNYVHYYDIGDYLSREQKLKIIKEYNSIKNINWKKIIPDENNDWINRRSNSFDKFESLAPKVKFHDKNKTIFTANTSGIVTSRDAWVYNFSKSKLAYNVNKLINNYNENVQEMNENRKIKVDFNYRDYIITDPQKIKWSKNLEDDANKGIMHTFDYKCIIKGIYRPFCPQYLYYNKDMNWSLYSTQSLFMDNVFENLVIQTTGIGVSKPFSALILKDVMNYHTMDTGQSFPLYWYEKGDTNSLFGNECIRHDGISDYILDKVKKDYNKNISKEDIFYYVYGILHSEDYKRTFESDLKKVLPKIPILDNYEEFEAFNIAGRKLANLHLNYESIEPYNKCNILVYPNANYKVIKMKFGKNKNKSVIEYNDKITITNIPLRAYEYVVNGKSAIEWIMERYAITTDSKSGIINDPNDWCEEVNDERYIFDLLLRIINVSIQTIDIVESLPKLDFE